MKSADFNTIAILILSFLNLLLNICVILHYVQIRRIEKQLSQQELRKKILDLIETEFLSGGNETYHY